MEKIVCECNVIPFVDVIAALIALISLIVAIVNVKAYMRLQKEYNKMVETQMLTGQGALETQVRSAIGEAYQNWVSLGVMLAKNPTDDFLKNVVAGAEEVYRNAYEDACGKYNDGKVDKDRFKLMYQTEIRRLVEEEPHKEFYANNQSPYDATLKVYNEWYHQERR